MTTFDVLNRLTTIDRHLLVEASAGTGKTYTIEHLFVRRLLTPFANGKDASVRDYASVKDIALVTFTRACAREIAERIRKTLQAALTHFEERSSEMPDYLAQICENGPDSVLAARRRIKQAKSSIDEAVITTIHGFCERSLSEYFQGTSLTSKTRYITQPQIREILQDYFASWQDVHAFSVAELKVLLLSHQMDVKALLEAILRGLWQGDQTREILSSKSLSELVSQLRCEAEALKLSQAEVLSLLEEQSLHFNGLRCRSGEVKEDVQKKFVNFSALFGEGKALEEDTIKALFFDPFFPDELFSEPKARGKPDLSFLQTLKTKFQPLLFGAFHPDAIFLRQVSQCQKFVTQVMRKRGLLSHQDLLLQTQDALQDVGFQRFLRERFKAVFVDEFQDTDPVQWNIFSKAFLQKEEGKSEWMGFLYLVGDPKQAIYGFRNADVYNYIRAKEALASDCLVKLTTNYRSTPELTEAINTLFVGAQSGRLFFLPKHNAALGVSAVGAGKPSCKAPFVDDKAMVHFFVSRGALGRKKSWPHEQLEEQFFSFIAEEIIQLKRARTLPESYAVLVKDRFQSDRLHEFLKSHNLASHCYRRESVAEAPARELLLRLFTAIASPKNKKALVTLLSFEPFFYSKESLQKLQQEGEEALFEWAYFVEGLWGLKNTFEKKGVVSLAAHFFSQRFTPDGVSVLEKILALADGKDYYRDLEHLFDLLIQHEDEGQGRGRGGGGGKSLASHISYLEELSALSREESDELGARYEIEDEAIQILTMHKSKGLEFDIVFALGVASRTKAGIGEEIDAEKMRQFYVACTRAKKRLYLPCAIEEEDKKIAAATASPMELFLTNVSLAHSQNESSTNVYEAIGKEHLMYALDYLKNASPYISYSEVQPSNSVYNVYEEAEQKIATTQPAIPVKKFSISSFSSIKKFKDEPNDSIRDDGVLPRGKETGILLHALLAEYLPAAQKVTDVAAWVKKRIYGTHLELKEEVLRRMLTQLLQLEFQSPSGSFFLREVDFKKAFFEMEFLYQEDDENAVCGIIDCAFEHNGAHYLIDWKSNHLADFSQEELQREIKQQGYDEQAKIYATAFRRYLTSFSKPFGGIFFVFLRAAIDDRELSANKGVVLIHE